MKDEVFGLHWWEEGWEEVLCLITTMVAESSDEQVVAIVNCLLEQQGKEFDFQNVFLAARCFEEMRNPNSFIDSRAKIIKALCQVISFEALKQSPPPSDIDYLSRVLIRVNKATNFLFNPSLHNNLRLFLKESTANNDNPMLRTFAITKLVEHYKEDTDTLQILKQHAIQDDNLLVRGLAMEQLARGWKDDPDTLPILKAFAMQEDKETAINFYSATRELARDWKDDPDVQAWLAQLTEKQKQGR